MFSRVEAFGQSDAGCVRAVNEDDFVCLDLSSAVSTEPPVSFLLAVADGIGGHAGGAIASAMAVQILREEIRKVDGIDPRTYLNDVFLKVNRMIFDRAAREPAHAGMGTTLVAAIGRGEDVAIANVGDSRAYLYRDGDLRQLTVDHSWAGEQRRRKTLTEHEISRSPFRSMITRSLGYAGEVAVDTYYIKSAENDILLFCTDGLYGLVPENRIANILRKHAEPQKACVALIAAAKEEGGDDNITVVIAAYRDVKSAPTVRLSDTVRIPPSSEKSWQP